MSEATRPGGLTALAVLHFVFGGKRIVDTIGLVAMRSFRDRMRDDAKAHPIADALADVDSGLFAAWAMAAVLTGIATIFAGIGCLRQRRRLGRGLGNLAALAGIGATISFAVLMRGTPLGDFNLLTLVALLFPLLTLFLLNLTFQDEFVR